MTELIAERENRRAEKPGQRAGRRNATCNAIEVKFSEASSAATGGRREARVSARRPAGRSPTTAGAHARPARRAPAAKRVQIGRRGGAPGCRGGRRSYGDSLDRRKS